MPSQFGDMHEAITKGLDVHHKRIAEIDQQVAVLERERTILKASAIAQLQTTLKLSPELLGHMVAGCR